MVFVRFLGGGARTIWGFSCPQTSPWPQRLDVDVKHVKMLPSGSTDADLFPIVKILKLPCRKIPVHPDHTSVSQFMLETNRQLKYIGEKISAPRWDLQAGQNFRRAILITAIDADLASPINWDRHWDRLGQTTTISYDIGTRCKIGKKVVNESCSMIVCAGR